MKKIISGLFTLLICSSLFAAKVTVSPVKTPYNEITTDSKGTMKQTVYSDSGMAITIAAELEDDNLRYDLELDNITDTSFLQRQDTIKTYYGNFEKNEWTENTTSAFSKNTQTVSTTDALSAAEACIVLGTTCACAFTLFEICKSTDNSPKEVKRRNVSSTTRKISARRPAQRVPSQPARSYRGPSFSWVIIDPVIVIDEPKSSNRRVNPEDYLDEEIKNGEKNIIVEENIQSSTRYSGSFYVPAGVGPDYKIRIIVSSDEFIDFYFSRSDRDNVANPLKDRNYGRHSILASVNVPGFDTYGLYYIYSGKYVGGYFGINCDLSGAFTNPLGYTDTGKLQDLQIDNRSGLNNFSFTRDPQIQSELDYINVIGGITIKTIPHTWLMLGCGVDLVNNYYYGNLQAEDRNGDAVDLGDGYIAYYATGVDVIPEIGLNLIFDHLDIAGTFQYSQIKGGIFNLMVGFAF